MKDYTKIELWKIQRPLATNMDVPHCLIYNEDRSKEGMLPFTEDVESLFPGGELKIFIMGIMNENGAVEVFADMIMKDPGW